MCNNQTKCVLDPSGILTKKLVGNGYNCSKKSTCKKTTDGKCKCR